MIEYTQYAFFVLGFILLIKGADLLIDGAASIAQKLSVPDIVIGLTVVAFGTSAPEFVINFFASIKKSSGLALGNIIGSNISNVCLILGVSTLIYRLPVQKNTVWVEIPFSIFCLVLLAFLANDLFFFESPNQLSLIDGLVFLFFFILFLFYTFRIAKNKIEEVNEDVTNMSTMKSFFFIIVGVAGLTVGGKFIFDASIYFARIFGLSEMVIGITIVAVGTSLPELATSIAAALKKKADIAIGNIVGSNIFNILWVLGASSILNPIQPEEKSNYDMLVVFLSSFLLFLFLIFSKKRTLNAWHGVIFLVGYVSYVIARLGFFTII